ncbi:GNAT family N-acetyltransferase [Micromonospora sp. SL4-19]|uniref:GNAT family N-acetyltransferase n=1 Tax=Micromonospora sp. SL4-19 TaxID=3399129 RepID=UPI003A4DD62C
MTIASPLRAVLNRTGVPGLSCRGATHTVRSARLELAVARVRDVIQFSAAADEVMRYRHGYSQAAYAEGLIGLDPDLPVWSPDLAKFVARERGTGRLVADLNLYVQFGHQVHVGGSVVAEARGQGYGREALDLVCAIAHRHLGLRYVGARCEADNVASWRWLMSAGFVRITGDPTHVLPDGREVETLWWLHSAPEPQRRCNSPHGPGAALHLTDRTASGENPISKT